MPDRTADLRARRTRRGGTRVRLLRGAARQRRVPYRCLRAGPLVRRRHRDEGDEVRIRAIQRRRCGRDAPDARKRRDAAAPGSGRVRLRDLRPQGDRRHDHPPRPARPHARRAARPLPHGVGRAGHLLRALGRKGLTPATRRGGDPDVSADRAARGVRRSGAPHRRDPGRDRRSGAAFGQAVRPRARRGVHGRRREGLQRDRRARVLGRGARRRTVLADDAVDRADRRGAGAVARFVDLKSPYTLGHSQALAELAVSSRRSSSGCRPTKCRRCSAPASSRGFGRLGVSNAIWDKPAPSPPGTGSASGFTRT